MIRNEWGPGELGGIAVLGPGSISEQEATVTCAMTPMGMAVTLGNCLPASTQTSLGQYISSETMQARHGLWQFYTP